MSSTITQSVPPQIRSRHAALPGIRAVSHNKNISGCFNVSLITVQIIRNDFGESSGDDEDTEARKTRSARPF